MCRAPPAIIGSDEAQGCLITNQKQKQSNETQ